MPSLLTAALLLLIPGIKGGPYDPYQIHLMVYDDVHHTPNQTWTTKVANKGILLGAMMRLQNADRGFNFTCTESIDYGHKLESINGLARDMDNGTYWQLLVQRDNETVPADGGIGCFIPRPHEHIIFKYTHFGDGQSGPILHPNNSYPIVLVAVDSVSNTFDDVWETKVAKGGILLGAMKRLQMNATRGFRFTYTDNPDYGPFLESINGVAGNSSNSTYWQVLVTPGNKTVAADVGIGCYRPRADELIYFKYRTFGEPDEKDVTESPAPPPTDESSVFDRSTVLFSSVFNVMLLTLLSLILACC